MKAVLVCLWIVQAWAQTANNHVPKFEDYPIKYVYKGIPANPKIVTSAQRRYRTRIREGVEKGWGVFENGNGGKEQNHPGPNFAGKMIIVQWGCGSPCMMMAVVDAETGDVYASPLTVNDSSGVPTLVLPFLGTFGVASVDFRLDSRLVVVRATLDHHREKTHSYTYYFVWKNNQWRLVGRVPLPDDEQ